MIYITAFFVPLIFVFLKVFQQRTIINDQEVLGIINSYAITAFEIICVTLIVNMGWDIYWYLATGGAVGYVAANRFHKKYFGGKQC